MMVLEWLKEEKGVKEPGIERADKRLLEELKGDEGLRQAKMSYHPVRFIEKFRVRLG